MEYFDQFWKAYPKKAAKKLAKKAFQKINPDEKLLKIMLDAIENQSKCPAWKKDNGQYIPYPATWLNGERWEDELIIVFTGHKNVPMIDKCKSHVVKGIGNYLVCKQISECHFAYTPECHFKTIEEAFKQK